MRKIEQNSFGWAQALEAFTNSDISIRELARRLGVSEKTVRNRIRADGWLRVSTDVPQEVRTAASLADEVTFPAAVELARRFCGTIEVLQAEVDTVIRNLHLIRELADAETDDDKNPARSRLIEKVLSLPGLVKAANDLTAALARLADNGPGKKEDAKDRAKAAGTGRFATPQAPKLVNETLQ